MAKNNRNSGQTRFAQTSPLFLLTPSVHGLRFSKLPAQCVLQEIPFSLGAASSIRFPTYKLSHFCTFTYFYDRLYASFYWRNRQMKQLLVIFPGLGYGVNSPLLYYADFFFETKRYHRIHIDYSNHLQDLSLDLQVRLEHLRKYELEQVYAIPWDEYDSVVFLSKSIGTVEAGWLADQLHLPVKHIFLTPIAEALPYCTSTATVIMGTKDKHYSAYHQHCSTHNIPALFLPNANHSLEVDDDPLKSIELLNEYLTFLSKMF